MILDRVTITGADDSCDPTSLSDIAEDFPFVEWGILFSQRRQGSPRYPSNSWLITLFEITKWRARRELPPLRLSAHLCGRYVRDFVAGGALTFADKWALNLFQRIQLNFHAERHVAQPLFVDTVKLLDNYEWILQHDGVNDGLITLFDGIPNARVYPLFDRSGGTGLVPPSWPAPIAKYQGYAGGIGPENIVDEIKRVEAVAGDSRVWIDMETRVRSLNDEEFDMRKVRKCLEAAAPFVKKSSDPPQPHGTLPPASGDMP